MAGNLKENDIGSKIEILPSTIVEDPCAVYIKEDDVKCELIEIQGNKRILQIFQV